ncbi:Ms4533A family Cys-rich leader peptide [Mycolicibacter kumamotonensis]
MLAASGKGESRVLALSMNIAVGNCAVADVHCCR